MRCIFVILACLLCSCGTTLNERAVFKPGSMTYWCEGGKMQCTAEKDASGQTYIQLRSLDPHTSINFCDLVEARNNEYIITVMMTVEKQNTGFKSWIHHQPLGIAIAPLSVNEHSPLTGKIVFETPTVQVALDEGEI